MRQPPFLSALKDGVSRRIVMKCSVCNDIPQIVRPWYLWRELLTLGAYTLACIALGWFGHVVLSQVQLMKQGVACALGN